MSWWYDLRATHNTILIKDIYKVSTFVETGTFRGVNLKFWASYFNNVIGCELNPEYYAITKDRLDHTYNKINYQLINKSSPDFLSEYIKQYRQDKRTDYVIFYLDAHFYDSKLPNKFVVLDELDALYDFDKAIIIIHDFDVSGLGHIEYDGISLNFDLVKDALNSVNPEFDYYRNTRERSDVHNLDSIKYCFGLDADADTIETINYHQEDRLKHRGLLYCLPRLYDLERL